MKAYGQFCPVAKAAEIVAERWTPLVLRELLCGSRRFSALHRGVPLMSPTLLASTNSRQVLGVMNQYALELPLMLQYRPSLSLPEAELHFASGVTRPLGPVMPQEAALGFLGRLHVVM